MSSRAALPAVVMLLGCTPALFIDAGTDAGELDAGLDAGLDAAARDGAADGGPTDAGADGGPDAGPDGGFDAGPPCAGWMPGCDTPVTCGSLCVTRCQRAVDAATARGQCEAAGGCLARIRNAADGVCLANLFVGGRVWVGGEQSTTATDVDEGWEWRCGAARQPVGAAIWAPMAPDDHDGIEDHTEDCLVYDSSAVGGYADDELCTVNHYFICMRPTWN
ncbi:MAG: C-type lectin domain-containing protein [Sandaracinaceae bacterium]|nr:C-type lectin domain-containing protein [Sandaracinaceae bacterium]